MCNLSFLVLLTAAVGSVTGHLDLVILHTNDMHGRFEETESNSGTCKVQNRNSTCVGGFARVAHEVRRFRKLAADGQGPEVLFLNAGDTYVGTTWYSLYTYNISTEFINIIDPDVICLGNHEFDAGVTGLAPFVDAVNCPIVAANLDFRNEPSITKVKKSAIIERGGHQIGIIGSLTGETAKISVPGKTIFYDEVESVRNESERLAASGVNIILVLTHSGYQMDQRIAAEVPLVDAVVGGHTNTFLWNGPKPDAEDVEGPYPKIVTQPSGKQVPVVQAYAYTKYLGVLYLNFDDNGDLVNSTGQPELLDSSIPQEEDVLELLEKYRPGINEINKKIIGKSNVVLNGDSKLCRSQECNFGNLIADAFAWYRHSISPEGVLPIGLENGGAIRNTIDPGESGEVTYGELLGALPFNNQLITFKLNGSDLLKTLEIGVRGNGETSLGEFLQVSGLKVVYDLSKPAYSRVVSVKVRCSKCNEDDIYEDLNRNVNYTIVTTSFLATEGGDDHYILKENGFDRVIEDMMDVDTVAWYIKDRKVVEPRTEGRITVLGQTDFGSVLRPSSLLVAAIVLLLNYII